MSHPYHLWETQNSQALTAHGKIEMPALFNLHGELIAATLTSIRHNKRAWRLLSHDDPIGKGLGWFNPSQARTGLMARRKDALHGYYIGAVLVSVKLDLYAMAIVRLDGGFSRNVIVLENGLEAGLGKYYLRKDEIG